MAGDPAAANPAVRGFWAAEGGECHIFDDKITAQLTYEELIGDGSERLHGRLEAVEGTPDLWKATLMILEKGQGPWYGPSCGEKPEEVGEIKVTLKKKPAEEGGAWQLQTQIKTEDDDDWQAPVLFMPLEEE